MRLEASSHPPDRQYARAQRWRVVARGVALLAGAFALFQWHRADPGYGPVFWLWVGATVAYVFSFPRAAGSHGSPSWSWHLSLVLLLLWAAAWRIPGVYEMPANISIDELLPGAESLRIAAGRAPNVFASAGWFSIPNLAFVPGAVAMDLLPLVPFHSLRLASVALGLCGIAATALLGRELFGPRAGWLGGFLLSVGYWHLHNSRTGFPFVQSSLAPALVAFLLLRAARARSDRQFALAGVAAGLCLHLYFPARAVLFLAPMVFVYAALRQGVPARQAGRWALLFLVGGLLVFAPLALNFGLSEWAGHSRHVTILSPITLRDLEERLGVQGAWAVIGKHSLEAAKMFTQWADLAVLNRSPAGLVDPLVLTLALLGVVVAVLVGNGAGLLLLAWFVAVFFLGVVISNAPRASYRLAPAMPAIFLLAGYALAYLWEATSPARNRVHGAVRLLLLVAVLATASGLNYWLFFDRYAKGDGKQMTMSEAMRFASRHCGQRPIFLLPASASWARETLPLFCANLEPADLPSIRSLPGNADATLLLLVQDWDRLRGDIARWRPDAHFRLHVASDGRPLFVSVDLKPVEPAERPQLGSPVAQSCAYRW